MKEKYKTKIVATTIALLLMVSMISASVILADARRLQPGVDFDGPHFNLNVHGVPDGVDKFKDDSIGSGRHSIYVPLYNTEPISIEFAVSNTLNWTVEDCDATTDGYASIILPRNMWIDTDGDGAVDTQKEVKYYKVYLVGLGKPGDYEIILSPHAEFTDSSGKVYYYWGDVTIEGHKNKKFGKDTGQPDWQNATDLFIVDYLEIWIDANGDGVVDQEWTDSNGNGVMDAGEWSDTNGNGVAEATEWTDANGNGVMDAGEWSDTNGNGLVDNELMFYTDEWVFNIEYLDGYWWDVRNDGVKLLQVRFYPVFGNGNN